MEEKFYNDGFEEFLQRQVKDQRMFPSDGVWRNINKSLHGDTYWPALTIAAFAFLAAIIAISVYFSPSPDIFSAVVLDKPQSTTEKTSAENKKGSSNLLSSISPRDKRISTPFVEKKNDTAGQKLIALIVDDILSNIPTENYTSTFQVETKVVKTGVGLNQFQSSGPQKGLLNSSKALTNVGKDISKLKSFPLVDETVMIDLTKNDLKSSTQQDAPEQGESLQNAAESKLFEPMENGLPSVPKQGIKKSKFGYVVYITPSRSYRKLTEDAIPETKANGGPLAQNYTVDVNKVVRYKPGAGIEAGVSLLYALNNKLKIRSGVQFNVRQYAMEAYLAPMELATIAVRTANGIDTISNYAIHRTANGYMATEITNRYYQVSIPVGLEWQVIGNKKVQLTVAASVQPTYLLNRSAYLITTDYKNYTSNSDFTRNWNINSNLEAFISVKSGDFKWQLGPQIRYQHLPTFITRYPIRENLVDYGIKLGVSRSIK